MKCKECGTDFKSKQYNSEFCCGGHRNAFNNRRQLRGATLYDLEMIERYEPEVFKEHDLATVRANLIAQWNIDDVEQRNTRKSWKRSFDVVCDLVRFR